jgi:hypothetical protein
LPSARPPPPPPDDPHPCATPSLARSRPRADRCTRGQFRSRQWPRRRRFRQSRCPTGHARSAQCPACRLSSVFAQSAVRGPRARTRARDNVNVRPVNRADGGRLQAIALVLDVGARPIGAAVGEQATSGVIEDQYASKSKSAPNSANVLINCVDKNMPRGSPPGSRL